MKPFGRIGLAFSISTTMNVHEWEHIKTWRKGTGQEKLRDHSLSTRGIWKTFGDDAILPDWSKFDETTSKEIHQAAFPIVLPVVGMRCYTDRGALVVDPFLGSGTTLIASEKISRRCFGFELDPRYVDLTVNVHGGRD